MFHPHDGNPGRFLVNEYKHSMVHVSDVYHGLPTQFPLLPVSLSLSLSFCVFI